MATVLRSSLDVLLLNLQARLSTVLGWPLERVVIDTEGDEQDDETHYQAEQVVFLRTGGSSPVPGFEGMGRVWAPERVRCSCVLWTRLGLDEVPGYAIGLTDPASGHEVAALAVRNALTAWQPTDADGNWLVQEPIERTSTTGPRRRKRKDGTWAKSSVEFAMTYAPALSQDYE